MVAPVAALPGSSRRRSPLAPRCATGPVATARSARHPTSPSVALRVAWVSNPGAGPATPSMTGSGPDCQRFCGTGSPTARYVVLVLSQPHRRLGPTRPLALGLSLKANPIVRAVSDSCPSRISPEGPVFGLVPVLGASSASGTIAKNTIRNITTRRPRTILSIGPSRSRTPLGVRRSGNSSGTGPRSTRSVGAPIGVETARAAAPDWQALKGPILLRNG